MAGEPLIGPRRIADSSPTRESSTLVNLMKAGLGTPPRHRGRCTPDASFIRLILA
jgi:hypothetical protein